MQVGPMPAQRAGASAFAQCVKECNVRQGPAPRGEVGRVCRKACASITYQLVPRPFSHCCRASPCWRLVATVLHTPTSPVMRRMMQHKHIDGNVLHCNAQPRWLRWARPCQKLLVCL